MLSKINRLKKKKDFENAFKKGKVLRSNIFVLRVVKNGLDYNRVGIVVSLKVSKKAVVRNKIRRRMTEAFKIYFGNIKQGLDLVFVILPKAEKSDFSDIKSSVEKCLNLL